MEPTDSQPEVRMSHTSIAHPDKVEIKVTDTETQSENEPHQSMEASLYTFS